MFPVSGAGKTNEGLMLSLVLYSQRSDDVNKDIIISQFALIICSDYSF